MSILKSLATNRPIVFGVIITVLFSILLVLISTPVFILESLGESTELALLGLGRLVITALFVFLLNRFGCCHFSSYTDDWTRRRNHFPGCDHVRVSAVVGGFAAGARKVDIDFFATLWLASPCQPFDRRSLC